MLLVLYNEQKRKMRKITNLPRRARLFEDLFQVRYFSSRQEHFLSRFLPFLAVKFFLRPSLDHSGKISQTFSKLCDMLEKTKKTIFSMTLAVRLFSDRS